MGQPGPRGDGAMPRWNSWDDGVEPAPEGSRRTPTSGPAVDFCGVSGFRALAKGAKKKRRDCRAPVFCGISLSGADAMRPPQHELVSNPVHERPQFSRAGGMTELSQRFGFDLADAFPGHCERLADFLERVLAAVFQPKTHLDDLLFARRQRA